MSDLLSGSDWNPVFIREARGRWRRPFTYLVIFSYAAILAWGTHWLFTDFALTYGSGTWQPGQTPPAYRLFTNATWLQIIVWLYVSATLAAPALSSEYERGHFTDLLLSGLTSRQVCAGKLWGVLSFAGLMLLVPLPISLLFLYEGTVSFWEILLCFILQAATAYAGAGFGLLCSASSRSTISAIIGVSIGCFLFLFIWVAFRNLYQENLAVMCALGIPGFLGTGWAMFVISTDWMRLRSADDASREQLPSYQIADWKLDAASPSRPALTQSGSITVALPISPANNASTRVSPEEQEKIIKRMESLRPLDEPGKKSFAERLNFSNALLQKEMRVRLRGQYGVLGMFDIEGLKIYYGVALVFLAMISLPALLPGDSSSIEMWLIAPWMFGLGLSAMSAAWGASGFTREREQGMLNTLLMTTMSPFSIVWGKLSAPLFLCAYYSILTVPFWIFFAIFIPLAQLLAIAVFIVASVWLGACYGLFFSWYCRQTSIAASGAIAAIFGTTMLPVFSIRHFPPTFWRNWLQTETGQMAQRVLNFDSPGGYLLCSLTTAFVFLIFGSLLMGILMWALRPTVIEREGHSILFADLTRSTK